MKLHTVTPEGAALVPLSRGQFAMVDEADLPLVEGLTWHATSHGYAQTKIDTATGRRNLLMHRLILPGVANVDHRDGNPLNNRRSNLRSATVSENQQNRHAVAGQSVFKGVQVVGNHGLWRVEIAKDGHRLHLGYYDDEERAARVYDAAAKVFFGRFACTNRDLGLLREAA